MTLKFLLVALSIFGSFFIAPNFSKAQETENCCQFNATDTSGFEYSYCLMTKPTDCSAASLNINSQISGIDPASISYPGGKCLDDKNGPAQGKPGSPGTHCAEDPANTTTNANLSACDTGSLADCIAARMPGKNGTPGTSRKTAGLLVGAIANVINTILGLMGLIFTIMLVYAGIQWIHYGGESDGKKKAIKRMRNAVIGLAITLSAYSITALVINNL